MKLSLLCIKRPVFATVLSLVLIVLGVIGYMHLNLRYFPDVPQKFASVSVSYTGASPGFNGKCGYTLFRKWAGEY